VRNQLPSNSNPTLFPKKIESCVAAVSVLCLVAPLVAPHVKGAPDISFLENPSQIVSEYIYSRKNIFGVLTA
jgi:hypothetical protein